MRVLAPLVFLATAVPALAGEQPPLVGLPSLAPLPSATGPDVVVKAVPVKQAPVEARVAMLELDIGEGVDPGMSRRISHALLIALAKVGRFKQVVSPEEAGARLPLEAQAQLSGCSTPSCLIEIGAMLEVGVVISPRLTLEQGGFRIIMNAMDLAKENRWARERSGLSTEAALSEALPALAKSLWLDAAPVAIAPSDVIPPEPHVAADGAWLRWGSLGVSVGGLALVGASNLMIKSAQDEYQPATATGEDYDALLSAQTQARIVWGGGLALAGAGAAGWMLLGP